MNYFIQVIPHRDFTKDLKKQSAKIKAKVKNRLDVFANDPFNPILNNHSLAGEYQGFRSINITGDIRAIYKQTDETSAIFIALGTHSKLYR